MKLWKLCGYAVFVAAVTSVAIAGKIVPDDRTVLYDSFEGTTVGNAFGPITYEKSLPGLGKAARLPLGSYLRYDVKSWYTGDGPAHPGVEGTVEFWVKLPRDYGEVLQFNWYLTTTPPASGAVYMPYITTDHVYRHAAWPGAWLQPLDGNTPIRANEWTHVATSWGPAGTKIYINGVLDAWRAEGAGWSGVPYLLTWTYVYVNHWGGDQLGLIDELHIAKAQLSDEEIAEHAHIVFNQAPVAHAGPERIVVGRWPDGAEVVLDGTASYDPDGDPLSYRWSWEGGEATGATPTLRLPCGTNIVSLAVHDGELLSEPDLATITVLDSSRGFITELQEDALSVRLYNPFPTVQLPDSAFLSYAWSLLETMQTHISEVLAAYETEIKTSSVQAMAVGWGFPDNFVLALGTEDSAGTRHVLTFDVQKTLPQPPGLGVYRVDFGATLASAQQCKAAFLHIFAATPPATSRPSIDIGWVSATDVMISFSGSPLEAVLLPIGTWLKAAALRAMDWARSVLGSLADIIFDGEAPAVVFNPSRTSDWYNVDVQMTISDASAVLGAVQVDDEFCFLGPTLSRGKWEKTVTSEGMHRVRWYLCDLKGILALLEVKNVGPTLENALGVLLDVIHVGSGDGLSISLPENVWKTLEAVIGGRALANHVAIGKRDVNIDRTCPNISWTLGAGTVSVTVDDPNRRQNSGLEEIHYWVDGTCLMDEHLGGIDTRSRDISVPTSFSLEVSAWDVAGNETRRSMDPYVLTLEPSSIYELRFLASEHYLWFTNNGLSSVELSLNDHQFRLIAHPTRRNQERDIFFVPECGGVALDFSSYIGDRREVVMVVRTNGPAGANGLLIFSDCKSLTAITNGSVSGPAAPRTYFLEPCHPNPFTHYTVVRYQLPQVSEVHLSIIDLLGREVRQLVAGNQPAGYYFVHWDGTTASGDPAASGVYLVRLETPQQRHTRKLLLAR
ncbi:MAG: T9SS type A sorting domain-containing protein [candidate division KSB1 bacterium]|nr:T9SS type A sorting domain-containing protein [candidate division KSB1 bacterium]